MKFKYFIPDDDENIENATEFKSVWPLTCPEGIAEDAADYEFYNRDGWEHDWPIVFKIFDLSNMLLGTFEVEHTMLPTFNASRIDNA